MNGTETDIAFGTVMEYECEPGYWFDKNSEGQKRQLVCEDDKTWTGDLVNDCSSKSHKSTYTYTNIDVKGIYTYTPIHLYIDMLISLYADMPVSLYMLVSLYDDTTMHSYIHIYTLTINTHTYEYN